MSLVNSDVDLGALARTNAPLDRPKRSWLRIVLPLVILAAFGAILWSTARDMFSARPTVALVRPMRLLGDDAVKARAPRIAVQAAGWVEPDPFPIYASALAGGVVAEVLVQESDAVTASEPLALLIADDARLAKDAAAAERARRAGALAAADARAAIAVERFDAALEVTEADDRARARRDAKKAEAEHRRAAILDGESQVALAKSEVIVQRELDAAGAAGARQVEIAEATLVGAEAKLEVLRADAALAQAEYEEAIATAIRTAKDRELRFEDRLERDVSAAEAERAKAELAAAETTLAEAELRLARMAIAAPVEGVVLERLAAPGEQLLPGAPVASLYDPASLRVRVDIPQSDVEALFVGMRAEVLSEARPGRPYAGEVIRIVQRADIQKVTLEAQVKIIEADDLLRPDMLMQVRFIGQRPSEVAGGGGESSDAPEVALGIPEELATGDLVWVYEPIEGKAVQRKIETQGAADGVLTVTSGLNLTDKLIDPRGASLSPGMRVEILSGGKP